VVNAASVLLVVADEFEAVIPKPLLLSPSVAVIVIR
jgi:hypothetical protein